MWSSITATVKDPEVFKGTKKHSSYKWAKRIMLPSVIDAHKWPHFQYAQADEQATSFRIEFVPVDIGVQGLLELHAVLASLVPNGWDYFVEHGHITRIDVAIDLANMLMNEFHFLPKQGATVKVWKSDGTLQTFQHGKANGNHTQIYNREAKRKAQKKPWQNKEGVRVERRLIGSKLPLKQLATLPNPFASIALVERHPNPPPLEKKPYIWQLFLNAAEHTSLPTALDLLQSDKRTMYRAHLKDQKMPWWDIDAIWLQWPAVLDELKIASTKHWI